MNNTELFSGRAANYSAGRPAYAAQLLDYLYSEVGFCADSVIADIGAGTGIFARQLLERGGQVICVEPNADMRLAAESALKQYSKAKICDGNAENTKLAAHSVDFITAAQAFHWFDTDKFKAESERILKPGGKAVLLWNTRVAECDLHAESSRVFEKYCPRFAGFSGGFKRNDARVVKYFGGRYQTVEYDNPLTFDKEKYIKRSLSSSYSLKEGDAQYSAFVHELNALFDKYAADGLLNVPNKTIAYIGRVGS